MSVPTLLEEPGRVDEPRGVQEFSDVFTLVAAERRPLILRRNGEDLAAVISLEHLDLVREVLARGEMENRAAQVDWDKARKTLRPPQSWFEADEPKPF